MNDLAKQIDAAVERTAHDVALNLDHLTVARSGFVQMCAAILSEGTRQGVWDLALPDCQEVAVGIANDLLDQWQRQQIDPIHCAASFEFFTESENLRPLLKSYLRRAFAAQRNLNAEMTRTPSDDFGAVVPVYRETQE